VRKPTALELNPEWKRGMYVFDFQICFYRIASLQLDCGIGAIRASGSSAAA
jgi:hypothetical protein